MWDIIFTTHPWVGYLVCVIIMKWSALKSGFFFGKEVKDFNAVHGENTQEQAAQGAMDQIIDAYDKAVMDRRAGKVDATPNLPEEK
ncbi:hypothetical protein M8J76_010572 [Diaphorina citri]|nr:hypothetical protein M8J75_004337 [Diaphorina citri]KAI5723757.1 hypothetical protein M8J76_010572 [Diaphorina citri]KAI5727803.1 hypothetical protein M8J77_007127 [Diaphorina citri]KAI5728810.1 hypothetical protein M8J77_021409 [Diaphorina citri]